MSNTDFSTTLYLCTGDVHPDTVAALTGVAPTEIVLAETPHYLKDGGEFVPERFYKSNLWKYDSGTFEESPMTLQTSIEAVLDVMDKSESAFIGLIRKYPDSCLVSFLHTYDASFGFQISASLHGRIAKYGLTLKFDIAVIER